ncbi:UNVERIFIED_CONTAM: hypothetical protein GTU68_023863 [Idotea baltica]|nr:hypothetical protein [Idotea baltica]
MILAKQAKKSPRDLANSIVQAIPLHDHINKIEIAGPGFLNFYQDIQELSKKATKLLSDKSLGVTKTKPAQRVVIDLSSPNLAKEMHVGHLRSTIIGDAVGRILSYLGDTVILQNHVGDWGTQFGMLLAYMEENPIAAETELADLEIFYRAAKKRFDESEEFANNARSLVVKLQAEDTECLRLWNQFNNVSLSHCQSIYDILNVRLTPDDVKGESTYNNDLSTIIDELSSKGLLSESKGAKCVFLDDFKNAEGNPLPVIVEKAGGGYLYATTDLAAMRYRYHILKADRVLYFVDQRQALHFQMVFEIARKANFLPDTVSLEHLGFGTMNGPDGRPFKTRDGGVVKLIDLLTEAKERAYAIVKNKNPDTDEQSLQKIANSVGIGAVKYADLSKNRSSDYNFNLDQMLSFEGNTAPYVLYAYTRVASVFRKANIPMSQVGSIQLKATQEIALAAKLVQFSEVLNTIAQKGLPHLLCSYLYEVSGLFSSFYENCPILSADEALKNSRLSLAALTGKTLHAGLNLLGIEPLEHM